jgi:hypothetical protein
MIIKVYDCAVDDEWDNEQEFEAWIRTEDIQMAYHDTETGDYFVRQYDAVGGEDFRIEPDELQKIINAMEEDKY